MAEERFTIAYDGPALDDHTIDARALAEAVLSMSDMFHRAQTILTPEDPPATLNIKAVEQGSFEVVMLLVSAKGSLDATMDVLLSRPAQAAGSLSALTGMVWASVTTIKKIAGRGIRSAPEVEPGVAELVLADGTTFRVPADQVHLVRDVEYRRTVREVMRPLGREGIESFRVTDESVHVQVGADDVPSFELPNLPEDDEVEVTTRDAVLQLLGVEFDGRKWRFTEGNSTFSATIEDVAFRDQIERGELSFGKNDLLRVTLRVRQYRDPSGRLKAEYVIERVLRHIDGGRQLPFTFPSA